MTYRARTQQAVPIMMFTFLISTAGLMSEDAECQFRAFQETRNKAKDKNSGKRLRMKAKRHLQVRTRAHRFAVLPCRIAFAGWGAESCTRAASERTHVRERTEGRRVQMHSRREKVCVCVWEERYQPRRKEMYVQLYSWTQREREEKRGIGRENTREWGGGDGGKRYTDEASEQEGAGRILLPCETDCTWIAPFSLCIHNATHTCIHVCMHTCTHACIYIHTCIHACMHVRGSALRPPKEICPATALLTRLALESQPLERQQNLGPGMGPVHSRNGSEVRRRMPAKHYTQWMKMHCNSLPQGAARGSQWSLARDHTMSLSARAAAQT